MSTAARSRTNEPAMPHPRFSTYRQPLPYLVSLGLAAAGVGCAPRSITPFDSAGGEPITTIRHVVLIDLKDAADGPALIEAMDRELAPIPGITHYWRGEPFDAGRPEVRRDYDIGLVVDFADPSAYEAYIVDERHVRLVTTWKPRSNALVIYDIRPSAAPR